jgi:hypothetical protein
VAGLLPGQHLEHARRIARAATALSSVAARSSQTGAICARPTLIGSAI